MYRKKFSFSAMTVKPVFCERPRSERVFRVPVFSRYSKLLPISRWLTKDRRYVSVNATDRGLLATSRRIYRSQNQSVTCSMYTMEIARGHKACWIAQVPRP